MRLVRDLMIRTVTTLSAGDTVEAAQREMALSNIRHLPVVDRAGALEGIVSDRDLGRARGDRVTLREVMTDDVLTVTEDTLLTEAAWLILRHRIGALPVCDDKNRLVGIVTEADFVRLAYGLLGGADLEDRLREEHEADRV